MSARRNYNRLWHQVAADYGQKRQPAPTFEAVPRGGGMAYTMSDERSVHLNPSMRRQLKRNPDRARFTVLHEWAHTAGANDEGNANRVANLATRDLRGKVATKIAKRRIRHTLDRPDV